jgi:hypothetical protein
MSNYKLINNVVGWLVFAIATFAYVTTMEPTASFWDCGEFIAVSYKLMVPHPPGAPLFLLIGRLFSMVAGSDTTQVAYWVNMVSALSSSFTVLFLFWTITMLARKMVQNKEGEPLSATQTLAVMSAGIVGGLSYTFSDSAWFSAVEAEVYAMSSLFTALVVWAMLRWETIADKPHADRWLVLIAYFTGLSIGVHLLNLVTLPALALIYYFKRYPSTTFKGAAIAFGVGVVMLVTIMSGVITGLPSVASSFEILFVKTFHLGYNTGVIFFAIVIVVGLIYGIVRTQQVGQVIPNLVLVSFAFILIGYASYGIILVRSNFDPPINENTPKDAMSFVSYLKREQYGDRPLLFGPQYNAQPKGVKKGDPVYYKKNGSYEIVTYKQDYEYESRDKVFLPRLYSTQANHKAAYKRWVKLPTDPTRKPSFGSNLAYLFKYQIGHMYWRYFMWNFAGRESDIQDADWVSPFSSTADLPSTLATNKGRNNFYFLPLILGFAGLFFQIMRNGRNALVVGMLFFFTGIAIVLYLNQPPIEPRERDYTFAGSFYAFSIWIGLGVLLIIDLLRKYVGYAPATAIALLLSLSAPAIQAAQGWDDHDRSQRYHSVDSAKNLLNSCAKNAVLFTGGDNDTFPLWYVQEVEGFRTDVRVCNLSLLGTDWYIGQMKRKAYDSEPLPIKFDYEHFVQGRNDYLPYYEDPNFRTGIDLNAYMNYVRTSSPVVIQQTEGGDNVSVLPTKVFSLRVDTNAVRSLPDFDKYMRPGGVLTPNIVWNINKGALLKSDLMMLEIIAENNWKRPIYFSSTLSGSNYLNLKEYMQQEGLAYRLLPIYYKGATQSIVNTTVMYDRLMKDMAWRNLNKAGLYLDENYRRFPLNARSAFYRLAEQLIAEGDNKRALEVINHCLKIMPDDPVNYDFYSPMFVSMLLKLGETKKADEMAKVMADRAKEELAYYTKDANIKFHQMDIQGNLYLIQNLAVAYGQNNRSKEAEAYDAIMRQYYPFAQQDDAGMMEDE